MSRTEQHLQRQTPILDSIKTNTAKITQGGVSSDLSSVQQVGIFGSDGTDWKPVEVSASGHMKVDLDITSEGLSTSAKQDDMISKLTDIELNTQPKTPVLNRTEAIPVQIMVGSSGSQYDALRANGQDLMVMIDDMNPDVSVNSGLSTSARQDTSNTSLASIDGKVVLPSALTASGNLKVSVEEGAITGYATSANQTTANTSLATISGDTTSLDTKITSGADASLSSAQQVVIYGKHSSTLYPVKTSGSGVLKTEETISWSTDTLMTAQAIAGSANANSSTLDLGSDIHPPKDVMFFITN